MKPYLSTLTVGIALALTLPVIASEYPFPSVSHRVAEQDLPCYMHNPAQPGRSLNLNQLCGAASSSPVNASGATSIGGAVSSGSAGGSNPGTCNLPTDRAKDGSLCGNRAASVRSGGR
jgi:hypothetical protein